jgi:hypothetical protein
MVRITMVRITMVRITKSLLRHLLFIGQQGGHNGEAEFNCRATFDMAF